MSNKGVILLDKHRQLYELMSSEDVKSLIVASLRYNEGMEVGELTYGAKIASVFMFEQIDHFNESYDRRCKSNAEIARRREAQRTEAADDDAFAEILSVDAEQPAETEPPVTQTMKRKTAVRKPKTRQTQNTTAHEDTTNEHEDTTNEHEPITNANHSNSNLNSNSNSNSNSISLSPSSSSTDPQDDDTIMENTDSFSDRETDGTAQREEYSCSYTSSDDRMTDDGNDDTERKKEDKNADKNEDQHADASTEFASVTVPKVGEIPTLAQVREHCRLYAPNVNADDFYNYYTRQEWKVAGLPVMSWRGIVRSWQQRNAACIHTAAGNTAAANTAAANTAAAAKADGPWADAAAGSSPSGESKASYDIDTFVQAAMRHSFEDLD